MIKFTVGNLFESEAECLINTVNCEGFMGKGIAYQFKLKYPNNNKDYVKACKNHSLTIGKLHYFKEDGKLIINFPTKDKWRQKSKIEYIESGLTALVELIPSLDVKSFAIPPLGCGNGGLEWHVVKDILIQKLEQLSTNYDFIIYEPSNSYTAIPKEPPKLNTSSLVLMNIKLKLNKFNSIRLQKTAYFMNYYLDSQYFNFKKHKYGPYDNSIAIISKNIKEFQLYYNSSSTEEAYLLAYRNLVSKNVIEKLDTLMPALLKATEYVNNIESDKDLECITTIMYLIDSSISPIKNNQELILSFRNWSEDKSNRFTDAEILKGINLLINTNIVNNNLFGYELNKLNYRIDNNCTF